MAGRRCVYACREKSKVILCKLTKYNGFSSYFYMDPLS